MIRPLRCLGAVSGRRRVVEYGRAAVDLRHRRDRAREDRQDALLGTLEVMVQRRRRRQHYLLCSVAGEHGIATAERAE
jgi:hypothetical protein